MAVRGGRERVDILAMDLDRLKADLAQELQMKEMLEQSMNELTKTVDDMENRIENISDESNEWKTRFETQQEVNQQLEKQIILLQDKVDLARKSAREMQSKAPQEIFTKVDFSDTLKVMDREKQSLLNQLRGIEWRTDQESKAYHKANEERKQYHAEIAATKQVLSSLEQRGGRVSMVASQAPSAYQSHYYESENQSPRYTLKNIPPDQRIIDPRRGPIKKTAAVKNLPRLNAAAADA